MLLELPTADEIDELAMSTPTLNVRKFEYDMKGQNADLDYAPCKGQLVMVIRGGGGTVLTRESSDASWHLPTDLIRTFESVPDSTRRVARELCGVSLRSAELVAMYDVLHRFDDVAVKRLYIVFAGITDDPICAVNGSGEHEVRFHADVNLEDLATDIDRAALDDACPE